jgi:hypothetical protein
MTTKNNIPSNICKNGKLSDPSNIAKLAKYIIKTLIFAIINATPPLIEAKALNRKYIPIYPKNQTNNNTSNACPSKDGRIGVPLNNEITTTKMMANIVIEIYCQISPM